MARAVEGLVAACLLPRGVRERPRAGRALLARQLA